MANNVGRLGVVLGIETADFVSGIEKAKGTLDKFATFAITTSRNVALATAAMSVASLKYADDIYEVAKANEVAIDTIVKMKMALGQSGGEAAKATKVMSSFASYVDKAAGGSFEAQQTFQSLGVSLKDLSKMSMDELLAKTVEGLGKQGDAITRNAKAVEIFSKAMKGVDVIDFASGMKSTENITKQTSEGIKEAGKLFDLLDKQAKDTALTFTNWLAPSMSKINELLDGYINKNRSLKDTIHDAVNRFIPGMIIERLPQYMRKTPGGDAKRGGGFDVTTDEPKRKVIEGDASSAKRIAQLQAEFEMARVMQGIDRARQEIGLQMVYNKETELQDVLLALQYSEELAKIEEERKKALAENAANKNKTAKADIDAAINQKAEVDKLTAAEKLKAELAKSASEREKKSTEEQERLDEAISKWQSQIAGEMRRQVEEQELLMQLANERLAYENSLYMLNQEERNLLMQQFDLEAKITEFKRQQMIAKEDPRDTEERAKRMRLLGEEQINLNKQTVEQQKTFAYGWNDAYRLYMDSATNAANTGRDAFNSVTQNMNNALDTFVRTGKLNFKSLAQSIIQDLIRIKLQAQATKLFGGNDSDSGIMGLIKSFMGGGSPFVANTTAMAIPSGFAFADGGSPPVGQASLVGERGPELFVPRSAGTVIPNNQLASAMGGGQTVNYNGPYIASMNAIDTQSGTQFLAKNKNTIWAAYQSANRGVPVSR